MTGGGNKRIVSPLILAICFPLASCGSTSASSKGQMGQAGFELGAMLVGAVVDGLLPDDVHLLEKAPRWFLLSPKENVSSDPALYVKPLRVVEPEKKRRVIVIFAVENGRAAPLVLGTEAVTLLDTDDQPVALLKRPESAIPPGGATKVAYTFSTKGAAKGVFELNLRLADGTEIGPVIFQKKRPS